MDDKDRISKLPDDILVEILTRLSLREAARTSLLARRWASLPARIARRLDFDASEVMDDLRWLRKDRLAERERYAAWVRRVLASHAAPELDELRICFDVDRRFSDDIDAWIAFAAAKRAKKLLLELPARWGGLAGYPYRFPGVEALSSLRPNSFRSLTDLTLGFVVFADGEAVQFFVDNCPALERLCVRRSRGFHSLRADSPTLRLKSLRILDCPEIASVRIAAQSLLTFEYNGPLIDVPFDSVPRLSEALLGGDGALSLILDTHVLFAYFSQLRTLKLEISLMVYKAMAKSFPTQVPELSNLEQLELRVEAINTQSILWTCLLVKAAPLLQRFSMMIDIDDPAGYVAAKLIEEDRLKELNEAAVFSHHHLKVLELIGYVHSRSQMELCLRLVGNAVLLEEVIIDVRNPFLKERPWLALDSEKLDIVRRRSEQLRSYIRHGVDLVIL